MSAAAIIAALDASIPLGASEVITLRLVIGDAPNHVNVDVDCIARVDAASAEQIAAGIKASDFNIIISPTQINEAQWPGGLAPKDPPFNPDPRIPIVNGPYKVLMRGEHERTVAFVDPKFAFGELVRLNMRISG
jgi:hypothetical protein